jgi:hypothetical protein
MELDKGRVAGMADPQIVQHTRLGAGQHPIPDVLSFLERQLAIEQPLQRLGDCLKIGGERLDRINFGSVR